MLRKGLCTFLCLFSLLGCKEEPSESFSVAQAVVSNIQDNEITLNFDNSFPHESKSTSTDDFTLKFNYNENTLFLKNGHIIEEDSIKNGMNVIFTAEENTLIVVEIVEQDK